MKQTIIVCLLIFFSSRAMAQEFPSDLWHDGIVVLVSEDTLVGKVKYNMDQDLVQIDTDNKILTYSSQKVFYFQIFDKTVGSYRQFYTLPYALVNQYEAPIIFEVLVEGTLTLLGREAIVLKTVSDNNPYRYNSRMTYSVEELVYTYFFLDVKGNITLYTMKKRDLMQALTKRWNKVDEYMNINHLRADKRIDLVRIISFYNGIL